MNREMSWPICLLLVKPGGIIVTHMSMPTDPRSVRFDWRRDVLVRKAFCRHAADRIEVRLGGLFDNHDPQTIAEADAILK